jgi:hypothetical protein
MSAMDWPWFLATARRHLLQTHRWEYCEGSPTSAEPVAATWCSFTTFGRLGDNAGYWTFPLPKDTELGRDATTDGGTWREPFRYEEIAHFLLPRRFYGEAYDGREAGGPVRFFHWHHYQDIDGLSDLLKSAGIEHRLSTFALEIKRF